eukprot:scaffold214083_cov49-Attheya_sp.AAC.3
MTWYDLGGIRTAANNSDLVYNAFDPSSSCVKKRGKCKDVGKFHFEHLKEVKRHYKRKSNFPWVLKDPRICITLKNWIRAFIGTPPAVLFTYRDPMEVAKSLQNRVIGQIPILADGLKLWIWYNRSAIYNSKKLCRVVTR